MEIINDRLLGHLPFAAEPLLLWQEGTDIHSFLLDLASLEGTILLPDGYKENISYRDTGTHEFHRGKRDFRDWAYRFTQSAEASAKSSSKSVDLIDFYEDPSFGTTAKYLVAWDAIVGEALSSTAFFSIAHISESLDDLECSCKLASELYYKHASQVLRSFIEDLVLPLYFAEKPDSYTEWSHNNYRTPSLRGKTGILRKLVTSQILNEQLASEVSELYDELNSFIHGSERRLVNRGHYTRSWMGHVFEVNAYLEWCNNVIKAVTLGIHLLRANLAQWEVFRLQRKVLCPICHNDKAFSTEKFAFGGEEFTRYHCELCGDEMVHNFEGKQAYGQSRGGQLISYQY